MVTEQDFMDAHRELVPSVSADELRHYDRVRRTFEGAGKQDDKRKQIEPAPATNGTPAATPSLNKGKGKVVAPIDEAEDMVVRTENIDLNGANGSVGDGASSGSGKGKGKAPSVGHASKSSVDIAEGGFGDAGDDEELYS